MARVDSRAVLGVALAAAGATAGGWLLVEAGHRGLPLAATGVCLFLWLLPYFLAGLTDLAARIGVWLDRRPARLLAAAALLLVPYVIYAIGTDTVGTVPALKIAAFVLGPACLVMLDARPARRLGVPDMLAILGLWLPLDFRLLRDVWSWPDGAAYILNVVLAVDLALLLFVSFRGLDDVGYRFGVGWKDLRAFGVNLAMCLALVVPLAIATDFVRFNPETHPIAFTGSFLAILVTIALPEELLFRGLIQNLLHKTWRSAALALLVASLLFGLAHLNNGPRPDWRYAVLATIAGFFYGRAYLQSGGLMAAALVHASIDVIWREVFR